MRRLLAPLVLFALTVSPAAGTEPQGQRTAGEDRAATAAALAAATFDVAADALLAAGDDYPDALAGAGLAGVLSAPLLLTGPTEVPEPTLTVLELLGVETVWVLGGRAAIAETVELELEGRGYAVERVAGEDRYATAAAIAGRTAAPGGHRVFVASGETFADALVAGPVAYRLHAPVLLTERDGLPEATAAALDTLAPGEAIVVGGTAAVSEAVVADITERGIATLRVAGRDRMETAAHLADVAVAHLGFDPSRVLLARGDDFADALAAAPRGGELAASVVLAADPGRLGHATERWLAGRCEEVAVVEAVGGPEAVGEATLARAVEAVRRCGFAERTFTYQVGSRGTVHGDVEDLRRVAATTLNDPRGWALDGAVEFVEEAGHADLRLWLASPEAVESAAAVCHRSYSCRVGDDVYVNDLRWRESTSTYRGEGRSLSEYRSYVLNHEVGHWLGLGHRRCPGAGQPAAVMQQQSIRLDGCRTNVWPLESERQAVRERHLPS